ncbi:RNA polymerase sigma factor [Chitinophaga cymbidii]|uniref:DNA-directed RNA polymerase sigma-70 factor n=1 Tax=Chitinophaga cymbidii TaxID=1096750 RepID=A0A512RGG3_9BACT|nr:sigma-70 family RNA polymerase sigma factor [Chitinophaga cymbidii]GEP94754.1 DNA-directed RNA polymerase sigma-70 factor [Chitinophaga cymbidii]
MADTYDQENDLTGFWNDVLQGDTRAYARIHGHLHPVLYRYALAMLGDGELAEDAVQEVFIRIWYKKEQIGALNSIRAYFFTAIRRQALNQLRGLRNLHILPAKEPDIEFSPEDILIEQEDQQEKKTRISQYLNQLPRRQREVIYLRFYEELSYAEIADIMQVNYQSVINLAHKAISQLRSLMGHIPLWWLILAHLR